MRDTPERAEHRGRQPAADAETRSLTQDVLQFGGQLVQAGVTGAAGGYVGAKVAAAASKPDSAPTAEPKKK